MDYKLPVVIRPATPEDIPFIFHSFISCLSAQRHLRDLDRPWATQILHLLATHLLSRSNVLVAVEPNHQDQVFGYAIYEPDCLHWVYTKGAFRGVGVATNILTEAFPHFREQILIVTTMTPSLRRHEDDWRLRYEPKRIGG